MTALTDFCHFAVRRGLEPSLQRALFMCCCAHTNFPTICLSKEKQKTTTKKKNPPKNQQDTPPLDNLFSQWPKSMQVFQQATESVKL